MKIARRQSAALAAALGPDTFSCSSGSDNFFVLLHVLVLAFSFSRCVHCVCRHHPPAHERSPGDELLLLKCVLDNNIIPTTRGPTKPAALIAVGSFTKVEAQLRISTYDLINTTTVAFS